jgi:hypothetical protein
MHADSCRVQHSAEVCMLSGLAETTKHHFVAAARTTAWPFMFGICATVDNAIADTASACSVAVGV